MYGRYDARLRRRRRACALMGNIARHDNHETYMSVVLRLAAWAAIGDMDGSNSSSLQFVGSAVSAFNQGVNLRSHTST